MNCGELKNLFSLAHGIALEQKSAIRLIFSFVLLASFVMVQHYSSEFYSQLTVQEYENPTDTAEELLARIATDKNFRVLTDERGEWNTMFQNSSPDDSTIYTIGGKINESVFEGRIVPEWTKVIEYVANDSNVAALHGRELLHINRLTYLSQHNPDFRLHIASAAFQYQYEKIVIQKRSPLLKPINMA